MVKMLIQIRFSIWKMLMCQFIQYSTSKKRSAYVTLLLDQHHACTCEVADLTLNIICYWTSKSCSSYSNTYDSHSDSIFVKKKNLFKNKNFPFFQMIYNAFNFINICRYIYRRNPKSTEMFRMLSAACLISSFSLVLSIRYTKVKKANFLFW